MEGRNPDEPPPGVHLQMSGTAHNVVQAHTIGQVYLYEAKPIPHQVPAMVGPFVNRERELSRIADILDDPDSVRMTVVTGQGGVGKSALIDHLVRGQLRDRYPGGELHVDYVPPDSMAPSDALAACLRAMGVHDKVIPSTLAERANLFRTHTAIRPTLVVLDNVTDPAQVLPLVPNSPGSAVVVISSTRLSELVDEGAEPMRVEPLDDAYGAALVARLAGRDVDVAQPDLAALVRQCDGLPVALKAAAARLRRQPGLTIAALTDEIAMHGQDTVRAVFSSSYGRLPADLAAMFRAIGVLPEPDFGAAIVAAATATQPGECQRLLDDLLEANLLDQDATTGRFWLHGLLRRFAHDQANAEDGQAVSATQRRAAEHLLVLAAYADLQVLGPLRYRCADHEALLPEPHNPFADKASALRWLDVERGTLLATMRLAQQHGWHELVWQLAEAASALYVEYRYLVDWTESGELGATAARLAGNAAAEARLRSFAARAWSDLGNLDRAQQELEVALPLAESAADPRLLASVWEMYGRYYDHRGDHGRAADAYRLAIELFASEQDRRGVAFVSLFSGESLDAAGEPERAADTLRHAVELIREVGSGRMLGRALTALGRVATGLGHDGEARLALEEAVRVLRDSGNPFFEAAAQETLADLVLRAGDRDGARASLTRQRDLFVDLGSPDLAAVQERLDALSPA